MDCDAARPLLDAQLDGELDPASAREVEEHVRGCEACAALAERHRALSRDLREVVPLSAPDGLRERVVAQADAAAPEPVARPRRRFAVLTGAALAAGLVAGWFVSLWWNAPSAHETLVHDVVAAHVRALLPGHLTDVTSTDQHTVKPWFAGRIDYSPWVVDLAPQGFPLVGGRVDFVGGRRVAVLVYQRRQHVVELVVSPPGVRGATATDTTPEGYHVRSWAIEGQAYTAISDVSASDLAALEDAVRASAGPAGR